TVRSVATTFCLLALLAYASPVFAQAALVAASVDASQLPPESHLTLRPERGLEALAVKIARVLWLRSDTRVEVGAPPPPELIEAVPAGHVALARESGGIRLVMGAALGRSFEARIDSGPEGELDPRALALAIEALRDRAIEAREKLERRGSPPPSAALAVQMGTSTETSLDSADGSSSANTQSGLAARIPSPTDRDEGAESGWPVEATERAPRVEPRLYLHMYGGASPESKALRTGVGMGGGLCVLGHCVLLAVDYPLPIDMESGGGDVRYRYPTFSCSFYSQPFRFGNFMPAVSLGLLSRVGHFERDMGIIDPQHSLETDLGVRATLEGAYALVDKVELVAEGGVDYALDRLQLGHGDSVAWRGPRVAPWVQASIRIRPY
ncbi:MAG TPA: hypothetical protein VHZ95_22600, partial [Polyangiales bacterium]|nr:hypothetical protein [Polyangiales bacterium]